VASKGASASLQKGHRSGRETPVTKGCWQFGQRSIVMRFPVHAGQKKDSFSLWKARGTGVKNFSLPSVLVARNVFEDDPLLFAISSAR
jgi:hypothetical protein